MDMPSTSLDTLSTPSTSTFSTEVDIDCDNLEYVCCEVELPGSDACVKYFNQNVDYFDNVSGVCSGDSATAYPETWAPDDRAMLCVESPCLEMGFGVSELNPIDSLRPSWENILSFAMGRLPEYEVEQLAPSTCSRTNFGSMLIAPGLHEDDKGCVKRSEQKVQV